MSERFYIHCADEINRQLFDTESDFNIHIEEVGGDEELLIQLCNLLNEQQNMIENLTKENDNCRNDYHELFSNYVALEKENEQLKEEIEPLKQKEEVLNKIWRAYLENHKEVEK